MATTEIKVPTVLQDSDLSSFFSRWTWILNPRGPVTIDFRDTKFLAPWAWVLYSIYGLWLKEVRNTDVEVIVDPLSITGKYAGKLGIGDYIKSNIGQKEWIDEFRTSPLTRIRDGKDIGGFAESVQKILSIPDDEIEGAVNYTLIELLRNVVQHSNSRVGGLAAAQYFPKSELVQVVVADFGVGLRATLLPRYPEIKEDINAIRLAMLPHVSGTFAPAAYNSMADNAGLGLFFIRQIATRAGGHFFLCSGNSLVDIYSSESEKEKRKYTSAPSGWHGTFAMVQLHKSSIWQFASLLSICRDLAAEARKDPSKTSLDFMDDIPDIEGLSVVKVIEFNEDVDAAAKVREDCIIPALIDNQLIVLDFRGIKFATQSFVHALIYKLLKDVPSSRHVLSFANCSKSTMEAIYAVAAYAKADSA